MTLESIFIFYFCFSIKQQKAFSSLVNRSRVVFQLPTSPGSSCPADEEELVDGSSHPSAVARTTTGGSEHSAPVIDSEKRNNQCADPDRKTKNNSSSCSSKKAAVVSLVAVEFLLDQQRSFLPSSRLQPFQVHTQNVYSCDPLADLLVDPG